VRRDKPTTNWSSRSIKRNTPSKNNKELYPPNQKGIWGDVTTALEGAPGKLFAQKTCIKENQTTGDREYREGSF